MIVVMNLYRINLNLLIALDTLLKERNVTRAAKKLFITQAAMSNNLKQLRNLFQNELLFRSNNQLELTSLAKILEPKLHHILKEMALLIESGQSFDPLTYEKKITIGMVDIMASLILPKLMPILKKEAPGIELSITPLNQMYNADPFEKEQYDIGIARASDNYPLPQLIHKQLLFKDHGVCILHPKHPLAKKEKITLKEYLSHQHIAWRADNPQFASIINENLMQKGLSARDTTLHLPFTDTVFRVIEASDHLIGTVIKTAALLNKDKFQFIIKECPIKSVTVDFYIAWHTRNNDDMAHQWLRNKIIDICKCINKPY